MNFHIEVVIALLCDVWQAMSFGILLQVDYVNCYLIKGHAEYECYAWNGFVIVYGIQSVY